MSGHGVWADDGARPCLGGGLMEQESLFGESWYRGELPRRGRASRAGVDAGAPSHHQPQMLLGEEAGTYRTDPRDGLIARVVQSHSLDKAWYARRYADIVGRALSARFELWWVELFAGPGRLWVAPEHCFANGSPIDALTIPKPFRGYFFSDLDPACTSALAARTAGLHPNVHIATGSANDKEIHRRVFALVPQTALVVLYLDPEGIDVHFNTIEAFARFYPRIDLMVNFPAPGAARAVGAGHTSRVEALLGVDDPACLVGDGGRSRGIRIAFAEQLDHLGLRYRAVEAVAQRRNRSPIYDLMVASRDPKAKEFFEKAAAVRPDGQRTLSVGA